MNKFLGLCGMLGGLLRVVDSFIYRLEPGDWLELLYVATDLGLILGLVGLYLVHRSALTGIGHAGFVLALCSFSFIAGPEASIFGVGAYWIGSPLIGLGMVLLSVSQLRVEPKNKLGPVAIISSVVLGLFSMLLGIEALFVICGVLFGVGFLVNGYFVAGIVRSGSVAGRAGGA